MLPYTIYEAEYKAALGFIGQIFLRLQFGWRPIGNSTDYVSVLRTSTPLGNWFCMTLYYIRRVLFTSDTTSLSEITTQPHPYLP